MYARDIKQIADAICEQYTEADAHQRKALLELTNNIARRFHYLQPNFDRHKFLRRALRENQA